MASPTRAGETCVHPMGDVTAPVPTSLLAAAASPASLTHSTHDEQRLCNHVGPLPPPLLTLAQRQLESADSRDKPRTHCCLIPEHPCLATPAVDWTPALPARHGLARSWQRCRREAARLQLRPQLHPRRAGVGLHHALHPARRARPLAPAAPGSRHPRRQGQLAQVARLRRPAGRRRSAAQPSVRRAAAAQPHGQRLVLPAHWAGR